MRFVLPHDTANRGYTESHKGFAYGFARTFEHGYRGDMRIAAEHEPTSTDAEMLSVKETYAHEKVADGGLSENIQFNLAVNRHGHVKRVKPTDKPACLSKKDRYEGADVKNRSDPVDETVHTVPSGALMGV